MSAKLFAFRPEEFRRRCRFIIHIYSSGGHRVCKSDIVQEEILFRIFYLQLWWPF